MPLGLLANRQESRWKIKIPADADEKPTFLKEAWLGTLRVKKTSALNNINLKLYQLVCRYFND